MHLDYHTAFQFLFLVALLTLVYSVNKVSLLKQKLPDKIFSQFLTLLKVSPTLPVWWTSTYSLASSCVIPRLLPIRSQHTGFISFLWMHEVHQLESPTWASRTQPLGPSSAVTQHTCKKEVRIQHKTWAWTQAPQYGIRVGQAGASLLCYTPSQNALLKIMKIESCLVLPFLLWHLLAFSTH